MQLLTWVIVGVCVALVGVNTIHVLSCPSNNPDALEAHYEALQYRLTDSELHVRWQSAALNKIVNHLQSQLTALDRVELDELLSKSEEEAVHLALRLLEHPAPAMPWDVKEAYWRKIGGGETNSWSSYYADDPNGRNGNSTGWSGQYDDDWYGDWKKENSSGKSFADKDTFGGSAGRDDDDGFAKTDGKNEIGQLDDEYDDPTESFQKSGDKEVFRDNLSDADARHLCEGWAQEHNVKIGVDWGSLPFDLQQKWLQYACDYLLKS